MLVQSNVDELSRAAIQAQAAQTGRISRELTLPHQIARMMEAINMTIVPVVVQ